MAQLMQHGEDALSTVGSLDKAAGTKLTYKSIEPGNSFSRVPAMDEGRGAAQPGVVLRTGVLKRGNWWHGSE